jgi:hypothetical protein
MKALSLLLYTAHNLVILGRDSFVNMLQLFTRSLCKLNCRWWLSQVKCELIALIFILSCSFFLA